MNDPIIETTVSISVPAVPVDQIEELRRARGARSYAALVRDLISEAHDKEVRHVR